MKQLRLARWLVLALVMLCTASVAAAEKIRVLLLDGESAGPYHNWQLTTQILKMELEESGILDVTVATAPVSTGNFSSFKPEFAKYQVVVFNLDSAQWPNALCSEFEQYVRNGGGVVFVHAADNAFPG